MVVVSVEYLDGVLDNPPSFAVAGFLAETRAAFAAVIF